MSERQTAILCAILVALGPISMALYTPAMPTLVEVFATSEAAVKATLIAYFSGFAVTQLVCGPLSDAFGRKPVAISFLVLYLLASLAALASPSVEWLMAARVLQGAGAAVGVALSRAIVRDLYVGQTSARIMNTIALMLGLGPAVSPTLGGLTLSLFGWREIFLLMVIYGLVALAAVRWFLRETNRRPDRSAIHPGRLLGNYGRLLTDRRFLRPALVLGLTVGVIYSLATMLPFVLIDRIGLTPGEFGYSMLLQSGLFVLGSLLTRHLLRRVDAKRLVAPGLTLSMAAALLLLGLQLTLGPHLLTVMGPVGLLAFAVAFVMPATQTAAVAPFAQMAGSASALLGFSQMGIGLIGGLIASQFADPLLALIIVAPAMPILGALAHFGLAGRTQAGQPEAAPPPAPAE